MKILQIRENAAAGNRNRSIFECDCLSAAKVAEAVDFHYEAAAEEECLCGNAQSIKRLMDAGPSLFSFFAFSFFFNFFPRLFKS